MKFKIYSLGCKVNSYECNSLSSMLINKGYIEDNENPDIVIINTCSVTATADQKSRQHIRKFIKAYPNAITIVMGCYAQGNYEFIANEIEPSIVVGTANRNIIPELIEEYLQNKKQIVRVNIDIYHFNYEEMGVTTCSENTRAYLKIQDGCSNFCTYCVVPYRRGRMRSRDPRYVLEEAKYLVEKGYKEIVLSGIHVGGYGKDLINITFSDIVESILNIENLKSLRISSIEESEIDEKLINLLNSKENLAKHFHIPLQSGSNTTLKRMNRKYTAEEFKNKIDLIRKACPEFMLSTDVIVGFPGETEEDFMETYNLIVDCKFNQLHVFPYSARSGTIAAKMENQIDPKIKNQRAHMLIELSKKLWEEYVDRFINKEIKFLIEKKDKDYLYARSSNYIEIKLPSKEGKVGDIITVKLHKDMIVSK